MGAGSSSGDACSGRLTPGKRICFLGDAETLRKTKDGKEFESAETAEIAETRDTAGVRRGLDRVFVAAAGAKG
jgi:hypothetical protein